MIRWEFGSSFNLDVPIVLVKVLVRWLFMTLEAIARPIALRNTRIWSSAPLETATEGSVDCAETI